MKKNQSSSLNRILKVTSIAVVLFMLSGIITGCSRKKPEPKTPENSTQTSASQETGKEADEQAPEGMIRYDASDYELYYPEEWSGKVGPSDYGTINLYKDDLNGIEFAIKQMEFNSVEEAVNEYKNINVVSFEEAKTNKGDRVYLAENSIGKGIYFTAYLFVNNTQYELRASMTYDYYNKNIELVRKIAKAIHIKANNTESAASAGGQGTQVDSGNSEINQKLQKLEQDNMKARKYIKIGEIEDMMISAGGGETTFDHATLYSATWAVLTGLTQGHKGLLETCVYDPQNELYRLTSNVSEFANDDVAPHLRDFKVYVAAKDKVYIDLNEQGVDMQVYIQYNKIAGKYYFKDFIPE